MEGAVATLMTMDAPWWFVALGYAEYLFVACFFVSEIASLAFRRWVIRTERIAHAVPQERYHSRFSTPMISFIAAAEIGLGINPFR